MMLKRVLDKLVTALTKKICRTWIHKLPRAGLDFDQLCQVIGCYIFIPWV